MEKVKIGISSCLMGNKVRYDGGDKLDRFLADTLGRYADFVPVCPEVEMGLPVPREPMRLEGDAGKPRLVTIETDIDYTDRMTVWAEGRLSELEKEGLCGFIFKARSPSCAVDGAAGLFARAFMERFPMIPVVDEERLRDNGIMDEFIERMSAADRRMGR